MVVVVALVDIRQVGFGDGTTLIEDFNRLTFTCFNILR